MSSLFTLVGLWHTTAGSSCSRRPSSPYLGFRYSVLVWPSVCLPSYPTQALTPHASLLLLTLCGLNLPCQVASPYENLPCTPNGFWTKMFRKRMEKKRRKERGKNLKYFMRFLLFSSLIHLEFIFVTVDIEIWLYFFS